MKNRLSVVLTIIKIKKHEPNIDDEEIIKAAKELKNYCDKRYCRECIFLNGSECLINTGESPSKWGIKNNADS